MVATSFTAQPLMSLTSGLRQVFLPLSAPARRPDASLDKLAVAQMEFHGTLAMTGAEGPLWLPVGASAPIAPAQSLAYEITRSFPVDAKVATAPALFYLRTGDVLPGLLHGLDEKGLDVESPITQVARLSAGDLKAVQFDPEARLNLHGFSDTAGWRTLLGQDSGVRREEKFIEMEPGSSIGHPGAMQASNIEFTIEDTGFAGLRLRLFCPGTAGKGAGSLLLARMGNQLYSGMERGEGQLENRVDSAVPSGSFKVRLVIGEKQVELFVNGAPVQAIPFAQGIRKGAGLILEPASVWGNSPGKIRLEDFTAVSPPGNSWLPDVAPEAKAEALTVPRFRKDDPPHQALIAANGDVLRGQIEAATAASFAFRAGLQELTVPRNRVKAAIWLDKATDTASVAEPPKVSALDRLLQEEVQQVMFSQANLETFVRYLEHEVTDLKFARPLPTVEGSFGLQFGGTAGETLDRICALYVLSYHMDGSGKVVLEKAAPAPRGLVEKVYWLKPGSIPDHPALAKLLQDKGVAFPSGAAARWDAEAAELWMLNTVENQAKLGGVIASDFGGSIGSPTHWLLLTSGARLGLAMEQFGRDAIVGTHPAFGRCTIPARDVCAVRNTLPGPSAAMRTVSDWRLVIAPDPTLPEAGGDASALVGKDAPPVKLAMLDGGTFELAA